MKIISRGESKQILRNLYKKAAMEKYAEELRTAKVEERIKLLAQIDREVEQRVRQQIITGQGSTRCMMKDLRPYLASVALTALVLAAPGCGTPQRIESSPASFSEKQRSSTPFVDRGDYSERIGLVMRDALASHRFVNPWIVVKSSDESLWFVADRFESEHRFDRVRVRVTPDQHVTATITAYQFGPSDWAVLGTAFADFRPEADLMAGEIAGKLSGSAR